MAYDGFKEARRPLRLDGRSVEPICFTMGVHDSVEMSKQLVKCETTASCVCEETNNNI